ncbi:MAG: hypothetical protein ACRYGM_03280 [Janthinobacterium lividum]
MAPLIVLLVVAVAVLGAGLAGPRVPRVLVVGLAGVGLLASLAAGLLPAGLVPAGPVQAGLSFKVDGLSAVLLTVLFLLGLTGVVRPVPLGLLALVLLAADGVGLVLALALAFVAEGRPPALSFASPVWRRVLALAVCLAVAFLLLGGWSPAFAGMHAAPAGPAAVLVALAVLLAAALTVVSLPAVGGLIAAYLVARLLLDLSGPVTPGWWGAAVLLLGAAMAVPAARRAAQAGELAAAVLSAGVAVQGAGLLALGAALLARGADLLPLAAMAVAACLLLLLGWGVWGGLLGLSAALVEARTGPRLAGMGGLLRRGPALGLSMLAGLLSLGMVPLFPGFAALWLVLQALFGAGRAGGLGVLALLAGAVSVLGLVAGLLALAALRLGGLVLLGAPRSLPAAEALEPARGVRAGLAALVVLTVLLGVAPGLGLQLVQPAAILLAGGPMQGAGWYAIGAPDMPGYAAPVLLVLVAGAVALAAWLSRGGTTMVSPWQDGFVQDGVGCDNAVAFRVRPACPRLEAGTAALFVLGLLLAGLLGWAAR